ncbi:Valencene synthase [Vitis vinifera]|uniref:Valencene synthase n=1 Tax=Vitis vinifera TaxID=29760 RepID=A0A438DCK2_VITVI|nr:Valencene synthase [Vitis vinifera]
MVSARFCRHSRKAAKSLRNNKLSSQGCEVGFHLEVLSFQLAAYLGQLQEEIHNTAYSEFRKQIENAWMDISQECLKPTAVPMPLLARVLNLTRAADVIYKEQDSYTHVGKVMKNNIAAFFINPII